MKHVIGLHLKSLRRQRKVSQRTLARVLGVTQQAVSQWERGERPFPDTHVEATSELLGLAPEQLRATGAIRILRGTRKSKRAKYRPLYHLRATVEHLTTMGRLQQELHGRVKTRLTACEYDEIAQRFPRDTRHELTFVFHALDRGAGVVHTSVGRFRLPISSLHDETWTDGQDLLQPSLLFERGEDRLVIFGQPWINLPWDGVIRPDFLIWYKRKGQPGYWLYLEIDDDEHRNKEYRDRVKALAINLVGLRYENYTLATSGFFERFLRDVRALRLEVNRRRRERRRKVRELRERRRREAAEQLARS